MFILQKQAGYNQDLAEKTLYVLKAFVVPPPNAYLLLNQ